jgi:hypothetical protein
MRLTIPPPKIKPMKIEIELSELEHLKNELSEKNNIIKTIEKELKDLDKEHLTEKAVQLSFKLFDDYLAKVFEKLGFKVSQNKFYLHTSDVSNLINKPYWYNEEKITFELGADITGQFKEAFLKIGVIVDEHKKEQEYKL